MRFWIDRPHFPASPRPYRKSHQPGVETSLRSPDVAPGIRQFEETSRARLWCGLGVPAERVLPRQHSCGPAPASVAKSRDAAGMSACATSGCVRYVNGSGARPPPCAFRFRGQSRRNIWTAPAPRRRAGRSGWRGGRGRCGGLPASTQVRGHGGPARRGFR